MTPLENLLSKLPDAKRTGTGWSARCPAHEDRMPSLSVSEGDDGRALVCCHAGCRIEAVVEAVGLSLRDLRPTSTAISRTVPPRRKSAPEMSSRVFPTAEAAVAALTATLGPPTACWDYHDGGGTLIGRVLRWNKTGGKKEFRPISLHANGWRIAAMSAPRPLYRLPELAGASLVVVCEGEKAADAARSLGFTATTSAGGAQAAGQADWTPLAGKEVWVLPDNDDPGRKYADAVVNRLAELNPAPVVRAVVLPDLPAGGDIADWIDAHDDTASPEGLRAEVEAIANRPAAQITPAAAGATSRGIVPKLLCLADVQPVAISWLWTDRIPLGRITLLAGPAGGGKSFLTYELAARLSRGERLPDSTGTPQTGGTLLLGAEDNPADTMHPRLTAAGADLKQVHLLRAVRVTDSAGREQEVAFDLSNVELIREALDRLPACKLVVVDPIGSYLGGGVDAHRDTEVRAALAPLAQLAAERGVAVVLVCHTRKAEVAHADDAVLGSRAFTALARSVLHLIADKDDRGRKLLLPGKNNLAMSPPGLAFRLAGDPPRVEWEPEPLDGFHADDAVPPARNPGRGPAPAARDTAKAWLTGVLRNGPMPATEIEGRAREAGIASRTLRRAKAELGIVTSKSDLAGGWVWRLPEGVGDQLVQADGELGRTGPGGRETWPPSGRFPAIRPD